MTTADYSREIELVKRLDRLSMFVQGAVVAASPVLGLAALLGRGSDTALAGVQALDTFQAGTAIIVERLWQYRYGRAAGTQRGKAVQAVARQGKHIGALHSYGACWHFYDVAGIPISPEPYPDSESYMAPATEDVILSRVRAQGSRWIIDARGDLEIDTSPLPETVSAQTTAIVNRTRPHTTCRAWVLWGPPRGGKSIAARQIAHALTGGWVRLCGSSARSGYAWRVARMLGAEAIILDDLDVNAGNEEALLGEIERAREHCRVIISTMNVLPKPDSEDNRKKYELRGALLGPGRAADERPVHYATLDASIRAALAPTVPAEFRTPDLLSAYLVELELRRAAHGSVTQADLEEMRERMTAVGDR